MYSLARSLSSTAMVFGTFTPEVSSFYCFAVLTTTDDCRLNSNSLFSFFGGFLSLSLSRKKSNEGSVEICNDEEQYIISGHLRAPLAAIAEIMLQCLSNNAPDLLTHLSLSLSLSLSFL